MGADQDEPDTAAGSPESDPLIERHPFRRFFARHPGLDLSYRVVVGVLGAAIVVTGIGRLLDYARDKVLGWTHWVGRQSLLVRAAIGLGGLLLVAAAIWLYLATQGVPDWLPLV
jgi:hypothetical protein